MDHLFVFLLLRVQEKLYLLTQQLSSGMNCLREESFITRCVCGGEGGGAVTFSCGGQNI